MPKPIFWDLIFEFQNMDDAIALTGFPLEENQAITRIENPLIGKIEFSVNGFLGQLMTVEQVNFIQEKHLAYRFA